jgi:hypothetical protein
MPRLTAVKPAARLFTISLHIPADTPRILARIINRTGSLPAVTAEHDAPFLHQPRRPTTGRAIGLHLSGLQWVAGPHRRGSLCCRVGNAWTPDALLADRDDEVEGAL